jgi:hypothetical protein
MNGCMLKHASREEEDRAREMWFEEKRERSQTKAREKDKTVGTANGPEKR